MRFIYPNFLWALLLVAIPIIIHFVNLRRHQTVYFSNVNILKLVRKQTKRKSKLKQLLILTCRVLLMAALIIAFAKPYISPKNIQNQKAGKVIGLYIDNSYSMNAEGTEGKAIESAKQKALAIVSASDPNTKFALLTNELSNRQNRFYSQAEIVDLINMVNENHQWMEMSTINTRLQNLMSNFLYETNKSAYYISDFQKSSADIANFKTDSLVTYNFVPVQINSVKNLYIDSCWFEAPSHYANQVELLKVRLLNKSEEDYRQIPVNLYLNDSLKALAAVDIDSKAEAIVELQYTNPQQGIVEGRVEITDYPIVHDNTMFLAYKVNSELNILLIDNEGSQSASSVHLNALFGNDEFINLDKTRSDRIQIGNFANYEIIFMNEITTFSSGLASELQKYISNGGTVVIIPSAHCDISSYNNLLTLLNLNTITQPDTTQIPIGTVNYEHPLYVNVFKENSEKVTLPNLKFRYRLSENQQIAQASILSFADQTPALTEANIGSGKLYFFSFPISNDKNEFIDHVLFLPTIYNMAIQSTSSQKIYHTMGHDDFFEWKNLQQPEIQNLVLRHNQSGAEVVPKILPHFDNSFKVEIEPDFDAGFYTLLSNNIKYGVAAYNYKLDESDLTFYSNAEIETIAEQIHIPNFNLIDAKNASFASAISEIDNGKQFWKIFILISLFFVLAEAAIIKFWP